EFMLMKGYLFVFSSRRRHTRFSRDWSSDVCSSDLKDLDQIPGRHFNWVTGEDYDVGERAAEFYLMKQMLTGDVADNIPGIPGMGEKKAFALLSETEDLRSAVIDVYKQIGRASCRERV